MSESQPPISARKRLVLRRPDDWHLHLRDGELLKAVLPATARVFERAIVMPNLVPPVATVDAALAYRERIRKALPRGSAFTPLMTCYLTEETLPETLREGQRRGVFTAAKLYPAGATTNSAAGVSDIHRIHPLLTTMEKIGLPLLVHGEVVDPAVDIFDREAVFIEAVLDPLRKQFPGLRIVFEHLTSAAGVAYVQAQSAHLGATITPHHLIINRNHILVGGIRPHLYCLPIAKRDADRQALRRAATSGDPRFFLGTDSAPHPRSAKECACGCAGIFNAPNALPCLAQVFEEEGALDRLEAFVSAHGAQFYGLPLNKGQLTLHRQDRPAPAPSAVHAGQASLQVFDPGFALYWAVGD
ncbi:MAG: dihydroorotase [Desulfosarcinaceae bacterium]|nr:dihydroorotase [Desulfosarcinaceae bacterium]